MRQCLPKCMALVGLRKRHYQGFFTGIDWWEGEKKIRGGEAVGEESLAQLGLGLGRGQAPSTPWQGDGTSASGGEEQLPLEGADWSREQPAPL